MPCRKVVKAWAFRGIPVCSFDQAFIVAHQIHQEDIILRASSSVVIADLPPRLGLAYARHYFLLEKLDGIQAATA